MSEDAEDFIGGLVGGPSLQTNHNQFEHKESIDARTSVGIDDSSPATKPKVKKKWVKPLFIGVGLIAAGALTVLGSGYQSRELPHPQGQSDQVQLKQGDPSAAGAASITLPEAVHASTQHETEATMLGSSLPDQHSVASEANPTVEKGGAENSAASAQNVIQKPIVDSSMPSSSFAAELKEKNEIISDMKASIQSMDRDIEGLKSEIEILKQQKRLSKVVTKKISEIPTKAVVKSDEASSNTKSTIVVAKSSNQKNASRIDVIVQPKTSQRSQEQIEDVGRNNTPDSIKVLGVTMREGMEMAIVEIVGEKKRIFVGDTVPGVGKVSEITRTPSIVINGITYK